MRTASRTVAPHRSPQTRPGMCVGPVQITKARSSMSWMANFRYSTRERRRARRFRLLFLMKATLAVRVACRLQIWSSRLVWVRKVSVRCSLRAAISSVRRLKKVRHETWPIHRARMISGPVGHRMARRSRTSPTRVVKKNSISNLRMVRSLPSRSRRVVQRCVMGRNGRMTESGSRSVIKTASFSWSLWRIEKWWK